MFTWQMMCTIGISKTDMVYKNYIKKWQISILIIKKIQISKKNILKN